MLRPAAPDAPGLPVPALVPPVCSREPKTLKMRGLRPLSRIFLRALIPMHSTSCFMASRSDTTRRGAVRRTVLVRGRVAYGERAYGFMGVLYAYFGPGVDNMGVAFAHVGGTESVLGLGLCRAGTGVVCSGVCESGRGVLRFAYGVLPPNSAIASSGNACNGGPHENPMKLDAVPGFSFHDAESEDACDGFEPGLGRSSDRPGDTDDDWKKAENANPCESESERSGCGPAAADSPGAVEGFGSE